MLTGSLSHFSRRHRPLSEVARVLFSLCSFNKSPLYYLRAWHRLVPLMQKKKKLISQAPEDAMLKIRRPVYKRLFKPNRVLLADQKTM